MSADHQVRLGTTKLIESTFATVRHLTIWTATCLARSRFLGLAFEPDESAANT